MSEQENLYFILPSTQLFPINGTTPIAKFTQNEAVKIAQLAYTYYEQGQLKEALHEYTAAIQLYPEQPFFYACRSLMNELLQDQEGAFYDYQVAKKLDFNYHTFLEWQENGPYELWESVPYQDLKDTLNAALDATQELNYEQALACYRYAIKAFSEDVDVYVFRGALYTRLLRYDLALEDLDYALHIDPSHAQAYLFRAKLYEAFHNDEAAIADFNKAVEMNPANSVVYEERGNFFVNQHLLVAALTDFTTLVGILPDDFYVYTLRAEVLEKMDNWESALNDYSKAIALNPYYSDLYASRADMKEKLGDAEGAAEDRLRYKEIEDED